MRRSGAARRVLDGPDGSPNAVDVARYAVPHRDLTGGAIPSPGRQTYELPVADGPPLYAYAHVRPAQTLRVHFHGAVRHRVDSYPRFDRLSSAEASGDAYVSFADPTLSLDPDALLCWYLGGPGWDPNEAMARFVEAVAAACGARTVVLIGGSGGGFAALRLGLLLTTAVVYCFNPQIVVGNYSAQVVEKYVRTAFGESAVVDEVLAADPARFDLSVAYAQADARPAVLYAQNLTDSIHVTRHYVPFKRSVGVAGAAGTTNDGRIRLELVDYERDGHGPPSADEFNAQLAEAVRWSRSVPAALWATGGRTPG